MKFRSALAPTVLTVTALLAAACTNAAPGTPGDPRVPATPSADEAIRGIDQHAYVDACEAPAPGYAHCHAKVRIDAKSQATPSGFGPADLASAYALPATGGAGITVALVDAQDDPNAEADLAVYRSYYGLPACTTANGCFKKVNQSGQASPLPKADTGWSEEIALDLDMVSAACPSCKILLVEATTATNANLGAAVNTAVALGASVVSNSYGGSESSSDPTTANTYYNHPGVLITASSGDGAYGVEFPAAAPSVLGVGGTSLAKASNARGWSETVWNDAGSGCSKYEAKPAWQTDTGCAKRTVADVSAIADPNTGVAVYDSYGSDGAGWMVFGGTSVASPLVASIFALTGHASATPQYPYANQSDFNDVTSGSNGSCSSSAKYLCTGEVGYDGPTGIGTPNATLMTSATPPANDFAIAATSNAVTVASGASSTDAITTAIASGSAESIALAASGAPSGVTISFTPTSVSSGAGSTMTIVAASSVAAGTYPITVTGTASSGSHATAVSLTVTSTTPPANDFSLAATATTLSIADGASSTDAITTAVTSGAAESIALSASGAPSGVTISFTPSSVSSGAGSTMGVAVGASAAAGTYAITVNGAAASGTHSASVALTITAPPPPPPSGVVNGTFSTGTFAGWTQSGAASSVLTDVGYVGSDSAELGDYENGTNGASNIAQTFVAPAGSSKLTLVYASDCYRKKSDGFKATLADVTSGKTTTLVPLTCPTRFVWTTDSVAITAGHTYTITLTNMDAEDGSFSLVGEVATH